MPLKKVAESERGYYLFVEPNEVGGRRYWSDEIRGGVVVWDTALVSEEMLSLALQAEARLNAKDKSSG